MNSSLANDLALVFHQKLLFQIHDEIQSVSVGASISPAGPKFDRRISGHFVLPLLVFGDALLEFPVTFLGIPQAMIGDPPLIF